MSDILEENDDQPIIISRKDANQLIPSVESAYIGLQMKGKYLPKYTSSIISADYLLSILFEKSYVPDIQEVKIGILVKPAKKSKILEEIMKIELEDGYAWGFDGKHQPDKQWLVNVLKTFDPNNHLFKSYDPQAFDLQNFSKQQFQLLKDLDLSKGKKNNVRRFFKIPKEKFQEIEQYRKQERKKRLEKKIQSKNMLINEYQKEIQAFGAQIQQI